MTRNLGDRVENAGHDFPDIDIDGNPQEYKVFDRFGNQYDVKVLEIPNHSVIAGIFMLHFYDDDNNTGIGFDDASLGVTRRNVVIQVFKVLSALLMPTWNVLSPNPYSGTYYVEMDIRSNSTPSGPLPAGPCAGAL